MGLIKEYDDGLVVRTAEPGDKAGVADINAFGEQDYLQHMYDHYMENKNYKCFLAEIKGERVSIGPNMSLIFNYVSFNLNW